jgi:hypothetical protein
MQMRRAGVRPDVPLPRAGRLLGHPIQWSEIEELPYMTVKTEEQAKDSRSYTIFAGALLAVLLVFGVLQTLGIIRV